jgi:DNA-binding NarL/FixJ family response regulator
MAITVLIVDDHPMFRDALAGIIAGIEKNADLWLASSGEDALRLAHENGEPDLVLIDLVLPGMDGIAATRAFAAEFPGLPVVMVTGTENPDKLMAALQAGAAGLIPKTARPQEMIDALRKVLSGNSYVPAHLAKLAAGRGDASASRAADDSARAESDAQVFGALTLRQIEVLALIAQGYNNKKIAARLDINEKTVKSHLTRLFRVLGVVNRTQAVLAGQQLGLVKRSVEDG